MPKNKISDNSLKPEVCEQNQLKQLRELALNKPLEIPPDEIWNKIKSTRNSKNTLVQKPKYFLKVAASVLFVSLIYLVFDNHRLKTQLEESLQVNSALENQLMNTKLLTIKQANSLARVRTIEIELKQAKTTQQKLSLLQKRIEVMRMIVVKSQGEKYEYSI